MRRQIDRLVPLPIRAAALMPAAVLTVHQLRFELAFGGQTNSKLASEGHQYLGVLTPLAAMLVAIAAGLFLASLARARRHGGEEGVAGRASLLRLGLVAAATLLAIYCGQEFFEGLLCTGHPEGIAGIFGQGGLWAVPLSLLLGFLVAICLRVAQTAIRWVAARSPRRRADRRAARRPRRPLDAALTPLTPLAASAAGRAPPPRLLPSS